MAGFRPIRAKLYSKIIYIGFKENVCSRRQVNPHIFTHLMFQLASRPASVTSITLAKDGPSPRLISETISTCKTGKYRLQWGLFGQHLIINWEYIPFVVQRARLYRQVPQDQARCSRFRCSANFLNDKSVFGLLITRPIAALVSCWQIKITARLIAGLSSVVLRPADGQQGCHLLVKIWMSCRVS